MRTISKCASCLWVQNRNIRFQQLEKVSDLFILRNEWDIDAILISIEHQVFIEKWKVSVAGPFETSRKKYEFQSTWIVHINFKSNSDFLSNESFDCLELLHSTQLPVFEDSCNTMCNKNQLSKGNFRVSKLSSWKFYNQAWTGQTEKESVSKNLQTV